MTDIRKITLISALLLATSPVAAQVARACVHVGRIGWRCRKTFAQNSCGPTPEVSLRATIATCSRLSKFGATSEGAGGSIIESISKLEFTIDPNEIMKKAGGGAECKLETGQ
jgi:hypothetical protein